MSFQKKKAPEEKQPRHPWRDNIEAITMAIIMAVMLKYFIVEAYKIPTGSMQPTLMGNDETQIKDRILVDKFSYHFRDPERWEVTVFKYPLDLSKNFIKRLVGVGPEQLKIEYGDLWNRPDDIAEWKVLRRTRNIQEEVWKPLYPGQQGTPGWKAIGKARSWKIGEDTVGARGDGSLRYPPNGSIMDNYRDGYPLSIRKEIRKNRYSGNNPVGDVRLDGEVEALEGCEEVAFDLREGTRRYRFTLPGPAAEANARLSITATEMGTPSRSPIPVPLEVELGEPWRLEADSSVDFGVQNMDDLLTLEIDGEILLELEIPPATEREQQSHVTMHVVGSGAEFEDLMVYRDIYYMSRNVKRAFWDIPAEHYVMLGDNTQDSSDAREWTLMHIRYPREGGEVIRGNYRQRNENPRVEEGREDGITLEWFRDEFGELHHWRQAEAEHLLPARIPEEEEAQVAFVHRSLITGRAVVVFWPLKPSLRLWRMQWVR